LQQGAFIMIASCEEASFILQKKEKCFVSCNEKEIKE
jgi:hypothetical protein